MKPKIRLRSSKDIYHRLKWGGGIPIEKAVIGYLDRIEGMKEMAFKHFKPGRPVPWDRVYYFKLEGQLVWDRKTRLDRVFGSGETSPEDRIITHLATSGSFPSEFKESRPWKYDPQSGSWKQVYGSSALIKAPHLKILTYNILRTDDNRPGMEHILRVPELIREIENQDADCILLQEVLPKFWKQLLRMPWVRQHYFLSTGPQLPRKGKMHEVMLSKWPPAKVLGLSFSEEKEATGMAFMVNGHPLNVITLHLPSDMAVAAIDKRHRYLRALLNALPSGQNSLIAGDFNDDEDVYLPKEYQDLWPVLKGNAKGATFSPSKNPLAHALAPKKPNRRLDRIYLYNPNSRLMPLGIHLVGTKPVNRHGEKVYLSDHYGVCAEIATFVTMADIQKAPITHQSALAYIPPPSTWSSIQAIRQEHDPRFERWMPHLNLLFGFLPAPYFEIITPVIRQLVSEEPYFRLNFESFEQFSHGHSNTIWLKADSEGQRKMVRLQEKLKALFPNCDSQDGHGEFIPHLTVAKVPGRNAGKASRLRTTFQSNWPGLSVDVGVIALLSKKDNAPFEVKVVIPLGEETEWESFDPEKWNLKTSLGVLGLLPNHVHKNRLEKTQTYLKDLVKQIEPKAQLFSVGGLGLEAIGPESALDFLCVGRSTPMEFLGSMGKEVKALDLQPIYGAKPVPLIKFDYLGGQVNLLYAAYPDDVPLGRPSHIPTELYRRIPAATQHILASSLEVAALRRFIAADQGAFTTALLALKAWAKAQQIDDPAFGYPGGLAWTLMLAATPAEESPELWLERCFEMLTAHDWSLPLLPIEGFYPEVVGAAMQVVTASSPPRNVTPNVTATTLPSLLSTLDKGLQSLWEIRQEGGRWTDFFSPERPHEFCGLIIGLETTHPTQLRLAKAWVRHHFHDLLKSLGETVSQIRPWTNFISEGPEKGFYRIEVPNHKGPRGPLLQAVTNWRQLFQAWAHRRNDATMRVEWKEGI